MIDPLYQEFVSTLRSLSPEKVRSILVTAHARPDGDALGSILGLGLMLREKGFQVDLLNEDGCPESLRWMDGGDTVRRPGELAESRWDLAIVLDNAAYERVGPGVLKCLERADQLWNVDHHLGNQNYGDLILIDTAAAAVGELLAHTFRQLEWQLSPAVRDALFVAISTDTGGLKYSNVTARTFSLVSWLVEQGAQVGEMSRLLYQTYRLQRLEALKLLLGDLRLDVDGRLASWSLSFRDKNALGIQSGDLEGLIDVIRGVETVEVAVFFEELPEGAVKISCRSKGKIDVNRLCAHFGGGGHFSASGAKMKGPIDEARELFLQHAIREFT